MQAKKNGILSHCRKFFDKWNFPWKIWFQFSCFSCRLLCPAVLESLWQWVLLWGLINISCLNRDSVQVCGSKVAKSYKDAALGYWLRPGFGQITTEQPCQLHLSHSLPGILACTRQVIGLCINSGHLHDQSHFSKDKKNNTWKQAFSQKLHPYPAFPCTGHLDTQNHARGLHCRQTRPCWDPRKCWKARAATLRKCSTLNFISALILTTSPLILAACITWDHIFAPLWSQSWCWMHKKLNNQSIILGGITECVLPTSRETKVLKWTKHLLENVQRANKLKTFVLNVRIRDPGVEFISFLEASFTHAA